MPVKYAGQSGFGNHAAAPPSTDERAGRHRAVSASLPGKPKPALDHVALVVVRHAAARVAGGHRFLGGRPDGRKSADRREWPSASRARARDSA